MTAAKPMVPLSHDECIVLEQHLESRIAVLRETRELGLGHEELLRVAAFGCVGILMPWREMERRGEPLGVFLCRASRVHQISEPRVRRRRHRDRHAARRMGDG